MHWIVPYQANWPEDFAHLSSSLSNAGLPVLAIHHVGSTAVPAMPAKNVLDVDVEFQPDQQQALLQGLAALGYRLKHYAEGDIPGRLSLRPVPGSAAADLPAHHLYACPAGSGELRRHLCLRDFLRQHSARAGWLAEQKWAANAGAADRAGYIAAKTPAYAQIKAEAASWRAGQTLCLVHSHTTPADAQREFVETEHFRILQRATQLELGSIRLRAQLNEPTRLYAGQVGFTIEPAHRGHGYAELACWLLRERALELGLTQLLLTCAPDNAASRRTCALLGARLLDIVDRPIVDRPATKLAGPLEPQRLCRFLWSL